MRATAEMRGARCAPPENHQVSAGSRSTGGHRGLSMGSAARDSCDTGRRSVFRRLREPRNHFFAPKTQLCGRVMRAYLAAALGPTTEIPVASARVRASAGASSGRRPAASSVVTVRALVRLSCSSKAGGGPELRHQTPTSAKNGFTQIGPQPAHLGSSVAVVAVAVRRSSSVAGTTNERASEFIFVGLAFAFENGTRIRGGLCCCLSVAD